MIRFGSIHDFRKSLKKLTARPKDGFSSLHDDICDSFKDKSIEDIRNSYTLILDDEKYKLIKIRIAVSCQNSGKSNGVRLIYVVLKEKEDVYLLDVYPKKGASGTNNISDNEVKYYIETLIDEIKKDSIIYHNIDEKLKSID